MTEEEYDAAPEVTHIIAHRAGATFMGKVRKWDVPGTFLDGNKNVHHRINVIEWDRA